MKTSAELEKTGGNLTASKGSRVGAFVELMKLRLNTLVLVTTGIGFFLGSSTALDWWALTHTLLGTLLVAGGASALNQWMEQDAEKVMRRTMDRPIPSGRVTPSEALVFGVVLSLAGLTYLSAAAPMITALLAAATTASYLLLYTPLKKHTPICTWIGAIPGAIPPMIGWAAAYGSVTAEAWALFGILFWWQLPHFFAIAWLWRDDYQRAGYPMLTVLDPSGRLVSREIIVTTLALILAGCAPYWLHMAGTVYLIGSLALGAAFLAFGAGLARQKTDAAARRLFFASIIYLPLLLTLLVANRTVK